MTKSLYLLSLLTIVLCQPLAAESNGAADLPEVQVNDSAISVDSYETTAARSATKTMAALRDIPQIVNVVPQVVMREQHASSFQDALQNVAGLSFSVGDGQRDQVTIRGFTAILDQYVDGVRDDAFYYRDLSNIERIEVLKGPASVLYGRGSAGGMINRISKKPTTAARAEWSATLGSHGQQRSDIDLGNGNSNGTLAWRLTGALEDSRNFRDQYFLRRQTLAPSLLLNLSSATTLLLQADYLHDRRLADQGLPGYHGRPVDVPVSTNYGAANGFQRGYVQSQVLSTTATLDHRFNESLSWHSVVRAFDYSLDRNYTGIGEIKDGASPSVAIGAVKRLRDERGVFWQNELQQQFTWGTTRHQLLYGVELAQQNKSEILWNRNNSAVYQLFHPSLVNLPPVPTDRAPVTDTRSRFHNTAVYLQDLLTLSAHWKILAGVRYDYLQQIRDDLSSKNIDLKRGEKLFSPRVGVVFQPTEQLSWYASHSRSFQPLADSFTLRANTDTLPAAATVNNEIGLKLDLAARASITAALFHMSQTGIAVQDPENSLASLPIGQQSTQGLELSFAGQLSEKWELLSGYASMIGKISDSPELTSVGTPFQGNRAALTPQHSAHLWLKYRLTPSWYLAAGGRAESARFASPDNLLSLPGYAVLNLAAAYQSKTFDLNLSVKNALNRRYFVAAHSGANDYNMPGETRGLYVSLRYRF
ncbi:MULTISPECIES: TonB-dependent siderophore receptor [unclassified Undibacterium]|uniref:TonB-dependent receptor n=2 Tax=Pseudomonadota TaxID=1224 RepID=UPI002AC9BDD3|nr:MULTISPECIES: TonB-dependent siderophore receptor [unclassified Undibacterium]MEB0137809.1 TonB-dependent siderophore receptor [Undibacterium sp. CCC2.1]MEB0171000.1 TonB-dependent siderophore receptor [Undibacterium sp. CCC1.1]MEB0175045.1 TonB-dependent siderophore receptor [Undibacterium sp. CCC3.4]MEB0215177.1 TonB-dependent siderophore receptor [Undibacterium sp. 5I2]WPX44850.1 TonB-dependent siderophore receptor [Undibacterium sp. CCC3.4]